MKQDLFSSVFFALCALAFFSSLPTQAQTVVNPSFETDPRPPGNGDGPITGWPVTRGVGGSSGINDSSGPLADNGTIPDGTQVAFIYHSGTMHQVVSGFTPGAQYRVRYYENGRTGADIPNLQVTADGVTVVASHAVPAVGGSNPYVQRLSNPFTANTANVDIAFVVTGSGDFTLLLDKVEIVSNLVVTNTSDSGAGSLRQTVIDATAGSYISFNLSAPATISLTSGQITIDKSLTILGPGASVLAVQSGNPSYTATNRIFTVNAGVTAEMDGLSVLNGKVNGNGAGIYSNGNLTINGVTVFNNRMIGDGGGIYNNGGTLTVINSTISANGIDFNQAQNSSGGAGIYNLGTLTVTGSTISDNVSFQCNTSAGGTTCVSSPGIPAGGISNNGMLTVTNSTFSRNFGASNSSVPGAGAINNSASGTLNISNSIFDGNQGNFGGGILNPHLRTANITNSIFRNNSATIGGGIYSLGTTTVTSSTFSNNQASPSTNGLGGGAIYADTGTLTLTDSTISSNRATGLVLNSGGGGLCVDSATVNITNSTITKNSAGVTGGSANMGGGIYNFGNSATINLRNSIIAGNINTAGSTFGIDCKGALHSLGHNIIGITDQATITGDTTGNITGTSAAPVDALLAPLAFYGGPTQTHALLSNSPAINAGDTANAPAADQRGAARVGAADIGAFELNNSSIGGSFVAQLPDGVINLPYNYFLSTDSGALTYSLTGGALPSGLSISNHAAYTISGELVSGATPLPYLSVTLSGSLGGSTTSDHTGFYSFSNLAAGGNYTITPSAPGYTFTPTSRTFNNLSANQVNQDFTSTTSDDTGLTPGSSATPTNNIAPVSGTPTQTGIFNFSATATNGTNSNVTDYSLVVVTPIAPTVAVSRQLHAGVPYDINLPLTDSPGIECRSGGANKTYQLVLGFAAPITYASATVTSGTGMVTSSGGSGTNAVTINLSGVTDAQKITVTLASVTDGSVINNVVVTMGLLIGDANEDGFVNSGDATVTRNDSGQSTNAMNFRSDYNMDGSINSADATIVRNNSGHGLSGLSALRAAKIGSDAQAAAMTKISAAAAREQPSPPAEH